MNDVRGNFYSELGPPQRSIRIGSDVRRYSVTIDRLAALCFYIAGCAAFVTWCLQEWGWV